MYDKYGGEDGDEAGHDSDVDLLSSDGHYITKQIKKLIMDLLDVNDTIHHQTNQKADHGPASCSVGSVATTALPGNYSL